MTYIFNFIIFQRKNIFLEFSYAKKSNFEREVNLLVINIEVPKISVDRRLYIYYT